MKAASIGAPSVHSHFVEHPREHDSFFTRLYACRDAFYDPHWEIKNTFVVGLKGAILGAFVGTTLGIAFKRFPTFVLHKMLKFVE